MRCRLAHDRLNMEVPGFRLLFGVPAAVHLISGSLFLGLRASRK
jgi:hypothetical protein